MRMCGGGVEEGVMRVKWLLVRVDYREEVCGMVCVCACTNVSDTNSAQQDSITCAV